MKISTKTILILILYILLMTGLMIGLGVATYPDRYFFILIIPVLFFHRARSFLVDWTPFLIVLFSYEFLRGLADILNNRVNYQLAVWGDRLLFNTLPTIYLQQRFFQPGTLHWYDYLATIIYFLHFMIPITFGFLVWIKNRKQFREFVTGFLILSYAGLATYIAFPAAPPWLASMNNVIPHVYKILNLALQTFPERLNLPTVYSQFDPNQVAAVPSLHAAYPFLVLLFAIKFFGKRAYFFLPYVILVWISIVYLGEHYVFDVLVGVIYAIAAYFIASRINFEWVQSYFQQIWLVLKDKFKIIKSSFLSD